MKATWQGATLAENNDMVVVEGNHYFPAEAINKEHFRESAKHTTAHGKAKQAITMSSSATT